MVTKYRLFFFLFFEISTQAFYFLLFFIRKERQQVYLYHESPKVEQQINQENSNYTIEFLK